MMSITNIALNNEDKTIHHVNKLLFNCMECDSIACFMTNAIQMNTMSNILDSFIKLIGAAVSWLVLLMVLGTLYNVVARYWFAQYSIPLEEVVRIMNAMVFLLAAPLLLQLDQHVRVDVFYTHFSEKKQAIVDLFGTLIFLFPVCGFIIYYSWQYVLSSWQQNEASAQTGGLPALYLVKTLIVLVAVLLILQGLSLVVKHIKCIKGKAHIPHAQPKI